MEEVATETAHQLFARLSKRPHFHEIEGRLFIELENSLSERVTCVELVGKDATGKTEVLLHIILNTILPKTWEGIAIDGKESSVLLIDLDNKFPFTKLLSLIEKRLVTAKKLKSEDEEVNDRDFSLQNASNESFVRNCLKRFFKATCTSSLKFVILLHSLVNFFKDNADCILLLIDNINAFHWIDRIGGDNYSSGTKQARTTIKLLSSLIENYNIMVIITRLANSDGNNNDHWKKSSSWNGIIQRRYNLQKRNRQVMSNNDNIIFSCQLLSKKRQVVYFLITENGIEFLSTK